MVFTASVQRLTERLRGSGEHTEALVQRGQLHSKEEKKAPLNNKTKRIIKYTHWSLCETCGTVCSCHTSSLSRADTATGNKNTDTEESCSS